VLGFLRLPDLRLCAAVHFFSADLQGMCLRVCLLFYRVSMGFSVCLWLSVLRCCADRPAPAFLWLRLPACVPLAACLPLPLACLRLPLAAVSGDAQIC